MLFLRFHLGNDRYLLESTQVVEVVPLLRMKRIPHAAAAVAGVIDYRGRPVPVIDLSVLALGRSSGRSMSTRIIVVNYSEAGGALQLLGLIAEKATRTVRLDAADFQDPGVTSAEAPYLGRLATDPDGLLQWIVVGNLLPASVRDVLFQQAREEA